LVTEVAKGETFEMKLRVCFKDHYHCRAETCGEYDVCKVRLAKEEQTNEEWFDTLSTKEKAKWLDKVAENCCQICDEENRELCRGNIATGCKFENAEKWELWLKQPHRKERYR
jgi:hypothetical protein